MVSGSISSPSTAQYDTRIIDRHHRLTCLISRSSRFRFVLRDEQSRGDCHRAFNKRPLRQLLSGVATKGNRQVSAPPIDAWSAIIGRAAVSSLGIAALSLLIVGSVITAIIRPTDKAGLRFAVIVILVVFCGGLFLGAIYGVKPAAGSTATAGATQAASDSPAERSPPVAATQARVDCGASWTGWINVGGGVGDPCPSQCTRGNEIGQAYRVVGFPPRPQTRHKFQCWRK